MVSDATHADLTVDTQTVREPYATGFLYTKTVGQNPNEIANKTFQYATVGSNPLTLGAADGGYEAAYATGGTGRDEYINVRYPGKAYSTILSLQHTSDPRVFASAEVPALSKENVDSAYKRSTLSAVCMPSRRFL